jgi:hypothetical protein
MFIILLYQKSIKISLYKLYINLFKQDETLEEYIEQERRQESHLYRRNI